MEHLYQGQVLPSNADTEVEKDKYNAQDTMTTQEIETCKRHLGKCNKEGCTV